MKFKTVIGPDGKMQTIPDDSKPEEKVKEIRKSVREMLEGGGWYEDPNSKANVKGNENEPA
jgi:hypothetical protein